MDGASLVGTQGPALGLPRLCHRLVPRTAGGSDEGQVGAGTWQRPLLSPPTPSLSSSSRLASLSPVPAGQEG